MRILFIHNSCPGHYGHLARALAARDDNEVVFAAHNFSVRLPRVRQARLQPPRPPRPDSHPYLRSTETAVLNGQAAYRLCRALKAQGFVPDIVCTPSGWGFSLYLKEIFPRAPLLSYFEWFYNPHGSDCDYLRGMVNPDNACRIITSNAPILLDLAQCDAGICPTRFQLSQFPLHLAGKIAQLHDGIDTDVFAPAPPQPSQPPRLPGLDLSAAREVLTYGTRGMEPYRGFPHFMRAAASLIAARPGLHVVVAGTDRVAYGARPADGLSYKDRLLRELAGRGDVSRLHFVGFLPPDRYLQFLRASTVHVYLTVPFVLSWSLLEAMSVGCAVVGSDTGPVREVITDGRNGWLVDFRSPDRLAETIAQALDDPTQRARRGRLARLTVVENFALKRLLPRHLQIVAKLAGTPPSRASPRETDGQGAGAPLQGWPKAG